MTEQKSFKRLRDAQAADAMKDYWRRRLGAPTRAVSGL
jgi:hypothetical protein